MQKHIAAALLCFLLASAGMPAAAQSFQNNLQNHIQNKFQGKTAEELSALRISYMIGDKKGNYARKTSPSFFENKEESLNRLNAAAGYIFNMYMSNAFFKKTSAPAYLTLSYFGVIDPFYKTNKWSLPKGDIVTFYQDKREDITYILTAMFKEQGITYNPAAAENKKTELAFITALDNSTLAKKRVFGYGKGAVASQELSAQLKNSLNNDISKNNRNNQNLYVTYTQNDNFSALDNKYARSSLSTTYYRPVAGECHPSSYTLCKQFTAPEYVLKKYDGWAISKSYLVEARNKNDKFVLPASGSNFSDPDGKKHPSWEYHYASLFILTKDGQTIPVIADTFLLQGPAAFEDWAKLFSSSTFFIISPFRQSKAIEAVFSTKENLPRGAKPAPVSAAPN